jgi:hypothetical protein
MHSASPSLVFVLIVSIYFISFYLQTRRGRRRSLFKTFAFQLSARFGTFSKADYEGECSRTSSGEGGAREEKKGQRRTRGEQRRTRGNTNTKESAAKNGIANETTGDLQRQAIDLSNFCRKLRRARIVRKLSGNQIKTTDFGGIRK